MEPKLSRKQRKAAKPPPAPQEPRPAWKGPHLSKRGGQRHGRRHPSPTPPFTNAAMHAPPAGGTCAFTAAWSAAEPSALSYDPRLPSNFSPAIGYAPPIATESQGIPFLDGAGLTGYLAVSCAVTNKTTQAQADNDSVALPDGGLFNVEVLELLHARQVRRMHFSLLASRECLPAHRAAAAASRRGLLDSLARRRWTWRRRRWPARPRRRRRRRPKRTPQYEVNAHPKKRPPSAT